MTEDELILRLEREYSMLNQLLICVLMSQYYPDRLTWAVREFILDNDAKACEAAVLELQRAHDFLVPEHRILEGFLNYVLATPRAAVELLGDLEQRLAGVVNGAPQA